jgi:hypothetical protein
METRDASAWRYRDYGVRRRGICRLRRQTPLTAHLRYSAPRQDADTNRYRERNFTTLGRKIPAV